jgi:hypothetical protein
LESSVPHLRPLWRLMVVIKLVINIGREFEFMIIEKLKQKMCSGLSSLNICLFMDV